MRAVKVIILRRGYGYRRAHGIASRREATLAGRVKLVSLLLLALPLLFALAAAAPGLTVYPSAQPSWYSDAVPVGHITEKMIWEYGRANFSSVSIAVTWSATTQTGFHILGGKALQASISSFSGSKAATFTASAPLYPLAVAAGVYPAAGGYWYNATVTVTYSDGTVAQVSGSLKPSAAGYYRITDWLHAEKPVAQVAFTFSFANTGTAYCLFEYPDYAFESAPFTLSWTIPLRARFNSTTVEWWARPGPIAAYSFSSGSPSVWLDEIYSTATGTYTLSAFAKGVFVVKWTIPNAVITFYDGAMNSLGSVTLSAGTYYFVLDAAPTYVRLNGTLHYVPPLANGTSFAFAPSPLPIAFTIQDYGQGFAAIKAYDLQGRLIHARPIDSLGNAVLNLTAYASYQLALWKPGVERAFGTLTISQPNYVVTVLPSAPTNIPASAIQAWYNQTDSNFYVVVNCSNPPCTVVLRKYYPNGTSAVLATWTCGESYCRYTLLAADPLVTAEATDAGGTKMMVFAGTSLFGLLNETQKQALQDIFAKVAQGWPQAWGGQAGLLAFGGVLIFLALTIPGYLLLGALALGAYITLVGVIFNIWIVAGTGFTILIAVAAIEYIIRQS
ncbi:MAG: hypothetical protein LM576_02725 [Thermofilum sp.]|nr:hypothetical protein [Thermofilum sp.]